MGADPLQVHVQPLVAAPVPAKPLTVLPAAQRFVAVETRVELGPGAAEPHAGIIKFTVHVGEVSGGEPNPLHVHVQLVALVARTLGVPAAQLGAGAASDVAGSPTGQAPLIVHFEFGLGVAFNTVPLH